MDFYGDNYDMPMTPDKVWAAMQRNGGARKPDLLQPKVSVRFDAGVSR